MLYIWWRAFSIVTCTATNVVFVSGGHYGAAFLSGGLLSLVWWSNTRAANRTEGRAAQLSYGFGAACGTVCGMFLGRLLG